MQPRKHAIRIDNLSLNYASRCIVNKLTLDVPSGAVTALIGPNGCGKSTLLKGLVRALTPVSGSIFVEGQPITAFRGSTLARKIALLPQVLPVPEGITVQQLIACGRSPYNNIWGRMRTQDHEAVDRAMNRMAIGDLAEHLVSDLSGGQRQRVWIAMVVAQQTPIVLLDEPTTFLDINHQIEVLRFARELASEGKAVIAVLHDLNQAFRYADHIAVMQAGHLIVDGPPTDIARPGLLRDVFAIDARIMPDPEAGTPMLVVRE